VIRGGIGTTLIHFGMLLATLAFASWWTSHTILDTQRTRHVTTAVLENANLRHFVADKVASATAPTVQNTGATNTPAFANQLDKVLDRHAIRTKLENFVVDAHDVLIGKTTKPAVLDQTTTRTLVRAALPTMSAADLARVHVVTFKVPRVGALSATRRAVTDRFWLYFFGAVALIALAIVTSRDRRTTLHTIGKWLIGISLADLVVLWIIPVVILPNVTNNPWAGLIAAVARALSGGLLVGLVVLAALGVVFLVVDRFFSPAETSRPAPVPSAS